MKQKEEVKMPHKIDTPTMDPKFKDFNPTSVTYLQFLGITDEKII